MKLTHEEKEFLKEINNEWLASSYEEAAIDEMFSKLEQTKGAM